MSLGKLVSQLHEQIDPSTKNKIGGAIKAAELAIETGYFTKATDQKQISSLLADWIGGMDGIGYDIQGMALDRSRTVLNQWGNKVYPYRNDYAEKLDAMNVPKGTSEKATKTWTDLARKAFGSEIDDEIEMMIKLTELRVKVLALPINKSEKPPSKAAVSKKERDDVAMTCQICGGKYLAKKGKIAHHGYKRPGEGYQTQSCFGAMAAPFEVSRDTLGQWIGFIKKDLKRAEDKLQFASTSPELPFAGSVGYGASYRKIEVSANERNFDEVKVDLIDKLKKAQGSYSSISSLPDSFDNLRKRSVATAKRIISDIEYDLKSQQSRYDKWEKKEAE